MLFGLKQTCMLLVLALLLPPMTGCGSSVMKTSEPRTVSSVPEPKILQDEIELSRSFNARVTKVRFFEGDRSERAFSKQKKYETRFAQANTRTIYTEIHLDHPQPGKRIYFTATIFIRGNGRTLRSEEFEGRVKADWSSSAHRIGVGDFEPGKWRVGTYEVDVYINAEKVATGSFEIYS